MVVSIAFVEILLAITCFLFLRRLSFNDGLPWNWPIIGMLPAVFFNFHRLHEKCIDVLERSKGTFKGKGVWFTNMEVLLTSDPINVQYIMSKSLSNYPKGSDSKEIFEIVGEGLFNTDHDEWRKQRKMIHAFLNHQGFHRVTAETFGVVNLEKGLVPVLDHVSQQDIVVDLQDLFERLMFDVACILATGYDPCCLRIGFPQVPFLKAMEGACEVMLHRHIMPRSIWKLQRWLGIGKEKIHSHAYKTIDLTLTKYLSMKQEEMSRGTKLKDEDKEDFDMLKFFLTQGSEIYGKTLTDQIMKGNLVGLIFGVQDTTSIALTWLFWLISKNPSVETKIREEIQATFPSKEGEKLQYFVNREEGSPSKGPEVEFVGTNATLRVCDQPWGSQYENHRGISTS
ncbi:hypothetical protein L1049_011910 [Liquidambar formosana]|uniref:Cytochrome P450 n=1 Tax=Liquidambar formosana TaxID=63359 RepID=A0AAP0X3F8_LIQFO